MNNRLKQTEFPDTHMERTETLRVWVGGTTDIYISVGDGKKEKAFRWYLSGGQESTHPKCTEALCRLVEAFNEEVGDEW